MGNIRENKCVGTKCDVLSIPGFLNLKSVLRLLWSSEHKLGSCEEQTTPFRQSSSVENPKHYQKCLWSWTTVKTAGSGQVGFDIQKEEQKTLQLLIRVLKNREMVAYEAQGKVKWSDSMAAGGYNPPPPPWRSRHRKQGSKMVCQVTQIVAILISVLMGLALCQIENHILRYDGEVNIGKSKKFL